MIIISNRDKFRGKEELYIAVRNAEKRVVDDALLRQLPYAPESYGHHREWQIRAKSFERFLSYLSKRPEKPLNILDIGCGNGWMSHRLFLSGHKVTAVDLNYTELEQAETVFGSNDNLQWVYCDILHDQVINSPFDVIVLGASCQYFSDIIQLTEQLKSLLKPKGTIHLLDTFFYTHKNIADARNNTKDYYSALGFPEMSKHYYHHTKNDLRTAGYTKNYPGIFTLSKKPEWWIYFS